MSLGQVVIENTLKPDGTLELDEKPSLSRAGSGSSCNLPRLEFPKRGMAEVIDEICQGQ
jgi:hypothetical protein